MQLNDVAFVGVVVHEFRDGYALGSFRFFFFCGKRGGERKVRECWHRNGKPADGTREKVKRISVKKFNNLLSQTVDSSGGLNFFGGIDGRFHEEHVRGGREGDADGTRV